MNRGLPASPVVVDRHAPEPAHAQIADWLRVAIGRGELLPGDRLPGERELASSLGVSRMTLRQALADLEAHGDLVRIPGRAGGAFVSAPRVEVDLTHLTGLTDQLQRAGRRAGARVLDARRVVPDHDVSHALGLGVRATAFEVRRVRSANRVPVALETSWLPARLVPGLLDRTLSGSLYAVLRRHYGLAPLTAEERLTPVLSDEETSAHLHVPPGTPLMRVERTAHLADGTVIEFARDVFRADRVDFLVRRTPDEPVTLRAVSDTR